MALLMASDRRVRYALGLVKRSRLSGGGKSAGPANFADVWRRSNCRRLTGAQPCASVTLEPAARLVDNCSLFSRHE